ncbi:MAG: FHA domain-containing protein [Victivallales bacterium]
MLNMQGELNTAKKTIDVNKELKKQNNLTTTATVVPGRAPSPASSPAPAAAPVPALQGQPGLTCHYPVGQTWHKKDFLIGKPRLSITEDPHNSDVQTGIPNVQNINIVLQHLCSEWYVLESSNSNVLSVDGVPTHQSIIKKGTKHVLFIDKSPFVFSFGKSALDAKVEYPNGKPDKNEFSLLFEHSGVETRFKKDGFYILGPSEFCDYKIQAENTWFMIFNYKNCNYLRIIYANAENPVTVDSASADSPTPLFEGSKIMVGKQVLYYHSEQDPNRAMHDFNFNPDKMTEKFCLLCVDEQTPEKYSFALPPAGKALNVGRDSHCEIHIDSKDVSRKHSQIIMYERSALVFDCYSTNGTFVNGEKIAKRMLHPGDIVTFGNTKFMFCYLE